MITTDATWQALQTAQAAFSKTTIADLFAKDKDRFAHCTCQAPYWLLDYSRHFIDDKTLQCLADLANERKLPAAIQAMFNGEAINTTEKRAVLHTTLRDPKTTHPEVTETLDNMRQFCEAIYKHKTCGISGEPITDIVNIGIGGSDMGAKFLVEGLSHYAKHNLRCHFISNIAPSDLSMKLKNLNPNTILFIISSKSFTTNETLTNAAMAKSWLSQMLGNERAIEYHFVAVTSEPKRAKAFGILDEFIFPTWPWVGGRFSVWSAVGLPLMLSIGYQNFIRLLSGAHALDVHFKTAPLLENAPVLMALLGIWYRNFWGINNQAIIPYSPYLQYLPAYIQQLEMESNGKRVNHQGEPLPYATAPITWGGVGSDSQHTFHQWLHQSEEKSVIDFIAFANSLNPTGKQQTMLFANCIAQADCLMRGRDLNEANNDPHRVMPGNKPSSLLLTEHLTPESLGALLALYEHKIFCEGVLWDINSFDQFGVELGKTLAKTYFNLLESDKPSGIGALDWFKQLMTSPN